MTTETPRYAPCPRDALEAYDAATMKLGLAESILSVLFDMLSTDEKPSVAPEDIGNLIYGASVFLRDTRAAIDVLDPTRKPQVQEVA